MTTDIRKSIEACAAHYGAGADAMRNYLLQGQVTAMQMDNRGPLEFAVDGSLSSTI